MKRNRIIFLAVVATFAGGLLAGNSWAKPKTDSKTDSKTDLKIDSKKVKPITIACPQGWVLKGKVDDFGGYTCVLQKVKVKCEGGATPFDNTTAECSIGCIGNPK